MRSIQIILKFREAGNNRNFTTIGSVKALNNGKVKNHYVYTDAEPAKAVNYCRLKMVDKDGKYVFSAIQRIDNTNNFSVILYPNPVKNDLVLNFNSEKPVELQLQIINTEGKVVLYKKIKVVEGESKPKINVASFSGGNYFIKLISSEGETGLKFVKQ